MDGAVEAENARTGGGGYCQNWLNCRREDFNSNEGQGDVGLDPQVVEE